MAENLDLYASNINWRAWRSINWRRAIAAFTVIGVIVAALGFFGYRWMTNLTPVSRERALDMFKEESAANSTGKNSDKARADRSTKKQGSKDASSGGAKDSGSGGGGSSPSTVAAAAGSGSDSSSTNAGRQTEASPKFDRRTPEEGVYSWATDGWEEAAGIRREFPEESQRIITASDGDSWKAHHYFSEEREIWSEFVISKQGAHLASQRNRAKFGPVTNDSTIDFAPPMLVGHASLEVGHTWNGSWEGKTYGSYSGRIAGHGKMEIDGRIVEVYAIELRIEMKGELDGTVIAEVRLAPKYALTVYEHYIQDLQSDKGRYRAEWEMTVKSVVPQR